VSINIAAPDPAVRESTLRLHKEGIDHAAALGARVVVVHPSGEPNPDGERAQRMEYATACLAELAEYADQYGITVAVEDLPRTCLGNCIADIAALISADERLRVCLDTNHLLTERNADFVKALGEKIVTLHVSDYDYLNERHWWPYEGKVNWVELVTELEKAGYEVAE
jgi:sugar phosphate isomerase/epimerase